jgi:two-component system, chemotaxis family, protein-glutamate methylesterase/glutaminase
MRTNIPSIRVLVVDDSAFMRNTLSTMLMKFPDVQVVGTAKSGLDAIEQVKRSQPDVMTLDIDMPGMNGLAVLDYVMAHCPLPVIMVSALTNEGAGVTLQALERGAVDFIPKDVGQKHFDIHSIEGQLHDKVREAYQARLGVSQARHVGVNSISSISVSHPQGKAKTRSAIRLPDISRGDTNRAHTQQTPDMFPLVVIGSSTGGPSLLKQLVRNLPASLPASLIIIQHMPKFFTKVFAENLNAVAPFPIREARNGDRLEPGVGLVAPGDQHLFIDRQANGRAGVKISTELVHQPYRPSVDCAMASAAEHFGSSVIGVVVSGMGNDGVVGCQKIKEYGGTVLVQDEETAVLYGMPRAVIEAGWADAVVPDVQLAECMIQAVEAIWDARALGIPVGLRLAKGRHGSG